MDAHLVDVKESEREFQADSQLLDPIGHERGDKGRGYPLSHSTRAGQRKQAHAGVHPQNSTWCALRRWGPRRLEGTGVE